MGSITRGDADPGPAPALPAHSSLSCRARSLGTRGDSNRHTDWGSPLSMAPNNGVEGGSCARRSLPDAFSEAGEQNGRFQLDSFKGVLININITLNSRVHGWGNWVPNRVIQVIHG